MTDADLLLPDDDSFVQTAIQGLRTPTHLPDFWDHLASHLDEAHDELAADGHMALALVPDLAVPEPTPHHVEDPWPEPVAEPVLAPAIDLFAPVEEPVYEDDDEYEEDRADAAAAYDPAYDEPTEPVPAAPRHRRAPLQATGPQPDRSVVPTSLRRTSNAVLLALAILAAVVAVIAGLTLVRQRSEAGPSTPPQQALEASGTILAPRASLH